LREPPRILAPTAIVVVAAPGPVHVRGVDQIPEGVNEGPVAGAIDGYFRVAVKLAAPQLELFPPPPHPLAAAGREPARPAPHHAGGLLGRFRTQAYQLGSPPASARVEVSKDQVVVEALGAGRPPAPGGGLDQRETVIGGTYHYDLSGPRGEYRRTVVEQV